MGKTPAEPELLPRTGRAASRPRKAYRSRVDAGRFVAASYMVTSRLA